MNLPGSSIPLPYAVVSICWVFLIYRLLYRQKSTIPAIPGSSGFISSYVAALRFLGHPREIISAGYSKDRNGIFRFPGLRRWQYIANGRDRLRELIAAPAHIVSFEESVWDTFQFEYTVGPEFKSNPYHIDVIRGTLTRNLGRCFPRVRDEIVHAFDDVIGVRDTEWKLIQMYPASLQIVARTTNRLYVDLPVCREPEYLQICINFATVLFFRGQSIGLFPKFLRPIFGPLISKRKSILRQALKFLGPLIDERLDQENQYGHEWAGRPNDLISWLLDVAEGNERTAPALAMRILAANAVAIHTTSIALTDAIFDLAAYPDHIFLMREEAEREVATQGWTKAALGNMHRIDSFLRESMRINSGPVGTTRKVIAKDGFEFSDGTTIPYGALISIPSGPTHHDAANYEHPDTFDGFRFSRRREERQRLVDSEGTGSFTQHMVTTAPEYVVFGHGHHACPGRFFAATELKAMMAHILTNYDIKPETEIRPPEICFGENIVPNPRGKVWLRKRDK
ncbi:cytochrome P450 [Mycena albidolilacea]|uniref:Cytochrome P450 n=1 Tax=Mycena albidolilacea TaxID=1033008 RepID=A0AAD7F7J0_9AGAR|nr:cytochrome P450 [Mycena albidolilacea]